MKKPRVLISGAGIAGLALARRLSGFGIETVILEKRAAAAPGSSGIALPFNAVRALRVLELADPVLASAHQVHEIVYAGKDGHVLARASLDEPPLNREPFIALHRRRLHEILRQGIESHIHYGATVASHTMLPNGVRVTCTEPALSGDYDLLVAAEGLHSPLRKQSFADETAVIDYRMPNWRFVVEVPGHGLEPIYLLDRSECFMAYPLNADTLYCYCHVHDPGGRYAKGDCQAHIQRLFAGFAGPVPQILARLRGQEIIAGRLQSVRRPRFFQGRIAFVGDAGNACSPLLQQGAAAAFEDVICLSTLLSRLPVEAALAAYETHRRPRVEWVVRASDAPFAKIGLMKTAPGVFLRNLLIRIKGPLNVQGWRKLAREDGLLL